MPDRALFEQLDQAIDALLARGPRPESADPAFEPLMDIAGALRDLPDDRFKTRLGAELRATAEGRTTMSASTMSASTAPESAVIHAITPFISVPEGAKLIEFMQRTFGAEEVSRHPHGPGQGFVAAVKIGDSSLLIMGDESLRGREMPAALHVYVKDCDAAYQRALDGGAVITGPPGVGAPADRPYGERAAFVLDPFGNFWNIATRFGPNYVPQGGRHVTPCLFSFDAPPLIDFLKRAFGARVEGPYEQAGRLEHAFVHIGEAVVEMAEAGQEGLRPFGFYLYTDDVDAVYHRAVAAGAVSIAPPADRPFGDRMAVLQDPFGNLWMPARTMQTGSTGFSL